MGYHRLTSNKTKVQTATLLLLSLAILATVACSTGPEDRPDNLNATIEAIVNDSLATKMAAQQPLFVSTASQDCDDILRNQFIFQRNASTLASLNGVISNLQNQRPDECPIDKWNPIVASETDVKVGGTDKCKDPTIGNLEVPPGLHDKGNTGNARPRSGRDRENNIIIHWKYSNRPFDTANCWLYIERLSTWSAE